MKEESKILARVRPSDTNPATVGTVPLRKKWIVDHIVGCNVDAGAVAVRLLLNVRGEATPSAEGDMDADFAVWWNASVATASEKEFAPNKPVTLPPGTVIQCRLDTANGMTITVFGSEVSTA